MIKESKIKTLVLFAHYTDKVSYYDDWADAFSDALEFNVSRLNLYDLDIRCKARRHAEVHDPV